ncbi:YceI family protein [Motiliproteus sp.]|uniref:YceI family protein n=1 Tax=Motiliproteus sp. TaxID=1898955 RepID=UPI003BAD7532
MKKILIAAALTASAGLAQAADYELDPTHSFINFKTGHLGVSWLQGRFNDISGNFSWDADKPSNAMIDITINTASVDSNHAERDKHLRSDDFLDVKKYPTATFKSTGFDGKMLNGDLTLHGVTKPISFEVTKVGEGKDPWGGYRAGFTGTYDLKRSEFGIDKNLGPAAEVIKLELNVEGIRK